jgi:hypothetical protein
MDRMLADIQTADNGARNNRPRQAVPEFEEMIRALSIG